MINVNQNKLSKLIFVKHTYINGRILSVKYDELYLLPRPTDLPVHRVSQTESQTTRVRTYVTTRLYLFHRLTVHSPKHGAIAVQSKRA